MKQADLVRLLQSNGWIRVRQVGSHAVFAKAGNQNIVVPVHPGRDIPIGTLGAILKAAGLKGKQN